MRTLACSIPHLRTLFWTCAVLVACFPVQGFGHVASSASKREVLLRTGTIEITDEAIQRPRLSVVDSVHAVDHHVPFRRFNSFVSKVFSSTTEDDSDFRAHTQYFLHVKGPVTQILKDRLVSALDPYSIDSYLPHNTFVVVGPAQSHTKHSEFFDRVLSVPGVLSLIERDPKHKIAPEVSSLQQIDARERRVTGSRPSADSTHVELVLSVSQGFSRLISPADLASEWAAVLQTELGHSNVAVRPVSATVLRARVPSRDVHRAASALAQQKPLSFLEVAPKFELQNAHARYIIQDDVELQTRFWDHRIDGTGQVIAIGDTGVDYDSCFFADPDQEIVFGAGQHNARHRKIVSYVTFGTAGDEISGHGTHVAGTVAGEVVGTQVQKDTLSRHNGMAPKAKLAIYDFKSPGSEDLRVPENIYDLFYGESYENAGARITSNSWGAPEGTYSEYAVATDGFVYRHRNFLPVFAAGNYGSKGAMSISSPGVCKNVLTVGSSRSSSASFFELGYGTALEVTQPPALARKYSIAFAEFGTKFSQMRALANMGASLAEPLDACNPLTNMTLDANRRILLVQRGNCLYLVKARNAQAAGAVLMIVVQNEDASIDGDGMAGSDPAVTIPSVLISKRDGDPLLENPSLVRITAPVALSNNDFDEFHLSTFSSRGPTTDGRRKPDVLTPGEWITSVNSDGDPRSNNCPLGPSAVLKMEGTSMATPVASGAAALVRQYYLDGYYPSGSPQREDSIDPSASLVKATLIHSGDPIGGTDGGETVTPPPSYFQGFGRIKLGNVLWVNDSRLLETPLRENATYQPPTDPSQQYNAGWRLFVHDEAKLPPNRTRSELSTGDHDVYCFRVSNSTSDKLKVTLVWSDYPGDTSAALQLVNNLDLQVTHAASGRSWAGNQMSFADNQGSHLLWDELNNVEQVTVTSAVGRGSSEFYSVHVYATQINQDAQSYSLVVTGNIEHLEDASLCAGAFVCPNGCSFPFGECNEWGHCSCDSNHTGADCSISSVELSPVPLSQIIPEVGSFVAQEWRGSSTVALEGWSYFHLDITPDLLANATDQLRIQMKRIGAQSGDPDLYISFDEFPSLHKHTWAVTDCDSCQSAPSVLSLDSRQIKLGVLRIGVYGYCCTPSDFEITMQIGSFAAQPSPAPSGVNPNSNLLTLVAACVGAALVVFLVACACVRSGCKDKLCHYFSPFAHISSVRALTQPGPRFAPLETFAQVPHPPIAGVATELVDVDPHAQTHSTDYSSSEGTMSMVGPGVVIMTSNTRSAPFRPPPPPGEPPAFVVAAVAAASALAESTTAASAFSPASASDSGSAPTGALAEADSVTTNSVHIEPAQHKDRDADGDREGGSARGRSNRRGYASVSTDVDEVAEL